MTIAEKRREFLLALLGFAQAKNLGVWRITEDVIYFNNVSDNLTVWNVGVALPTVFELNNNTGAALNTLAEAKLLNAEDSLIRAEAS
ncbi:MAG: hypothetical protein ACR2PW_04770 [Gammaproteobacteria bacterium]